MTELQLITMGFKKKKFDVDYWYEFNYKGHKFITNDSVRNNKKDRWYIGYQNKFDNDGFWFNGKLKDEGTFKIVFHLLTGIDFKLAHQRKNKPKIK